MHSSDTNFPLSRHLLYSYAPDWICTVVFSAAFLSLETIDGFRREFSVEDQAISHPYAVHERVPNFALYMVCLVAPFILQAAVNYWTVRSFWDSHNSSLGLVLALALTGSITQVTKVTVGRPRPDLLDRCQPPPGLSDPEYKLFDSSICTQTNLRIMRDGFRSFPSGHSSMSFAGLGFFAFYLAGKVHLFDRRGTAPKAWVSLTPFIGAALVAISRTMDYRHHWQDVLVGSVLGTIMAYFSYRLYYPPLTSKHSHQPYAPRGSIPLEPDYGDDEAEELLPHHSRRNSWEEHRQDGTNESSVVPGTVRRGEAAHLEEYWRDSRETSQHPPRVSTDRGDQRV
ncbi:PAP2-domain-containing protein [Pterulicium gracile]|uniref:PAP2-domain-containing protein n=1 Tax=Pterulicium gracile TaxID=1884261 RepID=A0A5C3QZC4_9AGAR|nr:PAP2-domain-containing protein [Pterula gracilis]